MFTFVLTFDEESKKPLYEQLYRYIVDEIRKKNLKTGERLPSKRALAKHLSISINTVESAYSLLSDEGYIYSVPKSGFYVDKVDMPVYSHSVSEQEETPKTKEAYRVDFRTNAVDISSFPFATWIKLSKEVMYRGSSLLYASDAEGDRELREAIGKYLHEFRGVNASSSRIIVGAGIEYLLMLLQGIFSEKSVYAMENPGYRKISTILENGHKDVKYIPLDEKGLRVDVLREEKVNVVYLTPSHQFPTGITMPVGRRLDILQWADEKPDRYIIEDDYNSEFNFSMKPTPCMQGLTDSDRVVYLGTFSRVLAPSIRIAYMVLPQKLMRIYERKFSTYRCTVPRFEQQSLCRFITEGYLSRHLNRVKNIYRKRRDLIVDILKPYDVKIRGERAGVHLVVESRYTVQLIESARKRGCRLYDMGMYFVPYKPDSHALIIGYAGVSEEDILLLKDIFDDVFRA